MKSRVEGGEGGMKPGGGARGMKPGVEPEDGTRGWSQGVKPGGGARGEAVVQLHLNKLILLTEENVD